MNFSEIKKELDQNAKSSQSPYYTKVVPNSLPSIGVRVPGLSLLLTPSTLLPQKCSLISICWIRGLITRQFRR